jgi:hypothetical protein
VALLVAQTSLGYANGRVVELTRLTAGQYEIAVGTIPSFPVVGLLHLTMTLMKLSTRALVIGAEVSISARGPDSKNLEIGPITAQNNPTDPTFYDANTEVDREGTWTFTIAVSAEPGEASTDLEIEVKKSNPIAGIITLLTLLAFVSMVGVSIRMLLKERGKS